MSVAASAFGTIAHLIQSPLSDEIADDLSGEQETLQGGDRPTLEGGDAQPIEDSADGVGTLNDISEFRGRISAASKVVTEGTAKEYQV